MTLTRFIVVLTGLCVILALVLWLVSALQQLYWQVSWTAPFLGPVVVVLTLALLGALLVAFFRYVRPLDWPQDWRSLWQVTQRSITGQTPPTPPEPSPTVSEVKTEAAGAALEAVRAQVDLIRDRVARQALLDRSREIESSLARGELLLVVFGTGSAGKTSLVNALLGRVAGTIGPTMGTTEEGETYRLALPEIDRALLITDTPGILEAGVAGTQRDRQARRLAAEADLLIFVVEGDLQQSELEPLQQLLAIGKRSLLVFNKTDRYPEADRTAILAKLRERLAEQLPTADIVPIAARPAAVRLPNGETLTPDPEIMPLIRRIVAVLRAEGEELIADNMLLQAQRLSDRARQLIDAQRRRQAEAVVDRYQWLGAGAVAVTPIPVVDLLATAAVNAQMILELGKVYGCNLSGDRAQELALSLAKTMTGLGIVKGAMGILTTALQVNIATAIISRAIQAVTAAYLTRIAGRSFIEYFRHDQDWGDGGISEVVKKQFQLEQRDQFVKRFVQQAITKVVQPIAQETAPQPKPPDRTSPNP
ncbi:DUF697 domain-containing protein [Limnothrix sp. FACHB-881]|uniref:YcjF family protein n=1 Tax=Limnothrix sp. FACHB-881 TaxID=2692819 RepID=UPI00168A1B72|nr:GTP-binding protein [Limnothrix sp. FACHB-881]MBD2636995.1 DUF697 domain-containing protein [Limnothrix sp. FACHB-881]